MEIAWLEDFLTLSVTNNFSRAAETRHVSQPAFSRRIRNLEHWVGTPLVDRSVYPVALTPAGDAFRKAAEECLRSLRDAREEATRLVARSGEVISFAALHTLALSYFPRWSADLQSTLGTMSFRMVADNLSGCIEAVISGSSDLTLCYSHPSVPTALDINRYPSIALAQDRILPVSAPNGKGTARFALGEEGGLPYLGYASDSFLGRIANTIVQNNKLGPALALRYENSMAEALKSVAIEGGGLAWLPEICIRKELASGALVLAGDERFTKPISIRLYRSIERSRKEVERLWAFAKSSAEAD